MKTTEDAKRELIKNLIRFFPASIAYYFSLHVAPLKIYLRKELWRELDFHCSRADRWPIKTAFLLGANTNYRDIKNGDYDCFYYTNSGIGFAKFEYALDEIIANGNLGITQDKIIDWFVDDDIVYYKDNIDIFFDNYKSNVSQMLKENILSTSVDKYKTLINMSAEDVISMSKISDSILDI